VSKKNNSLPFQKLSTGRDVFNHEIFILELFATDDEDTMDMK